MATSEPDVFQRILNALESLRAQVEDLGLPDSVRQFQRELLCPRCLNEFEYWTSITDTEATCTHCEHHWTFAQRDGLGEFCPRCNYRFFPTWSATYEDAETESAGCPRCGGEVVRDIGPPVDDLAIAALCPRCDRLFEVHVERDPMDAEHFVTFCRHCGACVSNEDLPAESQQLFDAQREVFLRAEQRAAERRAKSLKKKTNLKRADARIAGVFPPIAARRVP